MTKNKIGILLTNVGSPDEPTASSLRRYLKKFLSDPRIIEIPKIIWQPILYGVILPFRSQKSAKLYQKIWTNEGSPLVVFSKKIEEQLQNQLQLPVAFGTHYGKPSIADALKKLHAHAVEKILIMPLYPQYSATTTAATFDLATTALRSYRNIPEIRTIHDYATDAHYIDALVNSIKEHHNKHGKAEHLLFSFHGIPERYVQAGDPYASQCQATANAVAEKLKLSREEWSLSFQSRLGKAKWLSPYTDHVLNSLPKNGIKHLHVICPGFSVDCLETLEEINIRGREQFLEAGGVKFEYIPALNENTAHLEKIILRMILDWH